MKIFVEEKIILYQLPHPFDKISNYRSWEPVLGQNTVIIIIIGGCELEYLLNILECNALSKHRHSRKR